MTFKQSCRLCLWCKHCSTHQINRRRKLQFFVAVVYLRSKSHPLGKSCVLKYENFILNYVKGIKTYGTGLLRSFKLEVMSSEVLDLISQYFKISNNSLNPVWLGAQKQLVIVCISLSWTVPLNDFLYCLLISFEVDLDKGQKTIQICLLPSSDHILTFVGIFPDIKTD